MKTIEDLARKWLVSHEHYEHDPLFSNDLESLKELITAAINLGSNSDPEYDSLYGDNKECLCGHPYYRHFDTYDDMSPIGCKYCSPYTMNENGIGHGHGHCTGFKEKTIVQPTFTSVKSFQNDEYCLRRIECTCPDCQAPGYGGQKP